jgi:hypothetical protein
MTDMEIADYGKFNQQYLREWANSSPLIQGFLYDIDLLPEQLISDKDWLKLAMVKLGWEGHKLLTEKRTKQ